MVQRSIQDIIERESNTTGKTMLHAYVNAVLAVIGIIATILKLKAVIAPQILKRTHTFSSMKLPSDLSFLPSDSFRLNMEIFRFSLIIWHNVVRRIVNHVLLGYFYFLPTLCGLPAQYTRALIAVANGHRLCRCFWSKISRNFSKITVKIHFTTLKPA